MTKEEMTKTRFLHSCFEFVSNCPALPAQRNVLRISCLALLALGAGCAETTWQQHQPTANDPPFGGGFEASRRPGYQDPPFDPNSRRSELRPVWRGDNGAPETRLNTGGSPAGSTQSGTDARIDRRTQ
jgi:hypothetical protein